MGNTLLKGKKWIIGAGYNPGFIAPKNNNLGIERLSIPSEVSYIELGFDELDRVLASGVGFNGIDISIHVSRTPITEPKQVQDKYIAFMVDKMLVCVSKGVRIVSVGVHLTGKRSDGIGALGFSSHYYPSPESEQRAVYFLRTLSEKLALPILVENANFYSPTIRHVVDSWRSVRDICKLAQATMIFDVSHAIIDVANNNQSPKTILGLVPWEYVSEIHLSGIITARDGSKHDGHSERISAEVWEIFDACLDVYLDDMKPSVIVTVEHSDICWTQKQDQYVDDFSKLLEKVGSERSNFSRSEDSYKYASSYLSKLLSRWFPIVADQCDKKGFIYRELVSEWVDKVVNQDGKRISLTRSEVPEFEKEDVEVAQTGFIKFVKERIGE